jgi:hypothetical protein
VFRHLEEGGFIRVDGRRITVAAPVTTSKPVNSQH